MIYQFRLAKYLKKSPKLNFCIKKLNTINLIFSEGGVGWAATQLAHTVPDVKVYGTTSREEKYSAVEQNGVQQVLSTQHYEAQLRQLEPKGVHLVVDSIGGANFFTSQNLLRPLGRAVLTGKISATKLLNFSIF